MGMIVNVVFTVAVIAVAAGAVTEFQLRIRHIGSAAHGAFVGVRCLHSCGAGLIGAGSGEGDGAGFCLRLLFEKSAGVEPPGQRNYIHNVLAKEQEIVGDGDKREQVVGEETCGGQLNYLNKC